MSDPRSAPTKHYRVLVELVKANGWSRGAEIGVLKGKTLGVLLSECPALHMTGVDLWERHAPADVAGHETYERYDMARVQTAAFAVADRFPGRCYLIREDSVKAAALVDDGALDFVFIDAAHTQEATRRNIVAWRPKARVMLGHDWWWPSVAAALDGIGPWVRLPESVWMLK
ncbi:MAG: class I SAM-dependent methyltransferase [Pseudomonadota bacterium]|nr:class I SAM-dependent methyltransferase [Pseudomonadota bacterium]